MKNNYLLSALMILILLSCKKGLKELTGDQPAVSSDNYSALNGHTLCYGSNTWENDVTYVGHVPVLQVVYNNKVYFFHNDGAVPEFVDKITIYDGTSWQVLSSDIPLQPIYIGFAFVIGNKAYFGYTQYVGNNSHGNSWQYNFTTNTWTEIEDFPDYYLANPAYFTVGNKGYVVGGSKNGYSNKTWEFDPSASPKWRQRANYPGNGRAGANGFSIGNKGYIVNGYSFTSNPSQHIYYQNLLEYNPSSNSWVARANFEGVARSYCRSFVIDGYAYVGAGLNSETRFIDFYKYDPADNDWVRIPDYSGYGECYKAFSINSKGYAVWRPNNDHPFRLKKFTPRICTTQGPVIP
jgi:hypothetical protein